MNKQQKQEMGQGLVDFMLDDLSLQGHDVCFAAVTRLRTFIMAIECAAVVYGGHE